MTTRDDRIHAGNHAFLNIVDNEVERMIDLRERPDHHGPDEPEDWGPVWRMYLAALGTGAALIGFVIWWLFW